MARRVSKVFALPLLGLATVLTAPLPEARAQTLFDLLFGQQRVYIERDYRGGGYREGQYRQRQYRDNRRVRRAPEARRDVPVPRAAAPKISAPSYYTYKPDPLVRVEFAKMAAARPAADSGAGAADPRFVAALAGLDGFELVAEKEIAAALSAHYAAEPDFVWVEGNRPNSRAREAIRVLGEASSYGLDAGDYSVTPPAGSSTGSGAASRDAELTRFEMALSARLLRYIADSHRGRIDPNRLSGYHDFPAKELNFQALLQKAKKTPDIRAFLESQHPQNKQYQQLRVELEALRASAENEIVVDPKTFVRPGGTHAELPKLLQLVSAKADEAFKTEYGELLARNMGTENYGEELVPLVKAVQERNGLKPDGIIGPRTVTALAGVSKSSRIDKVVIALESLRWLPSKLGERRVFINVPAYRAQFIDGGAEKLAMRVIVGQKSNQTTFFYDEIEQVDFNPYWGVPRSILVNEMLPRLLSDPGYLDRAGYEVTDSKGRRIPSSSIDWGRYGANIPYNVRQTPSEQNALGELKILFPNKHAIYMHDTPSRELFARDDRALSHGCVRLQDPRGMAAAVLQTTREDIAAELEKGHSSRKVPEKIPVYVGYFTAWPNEAGQVEYFGDIYDRDAHLKEAFAKVVAARAPGS
jgi:murein L,D-transpeptidase YcbB/YkuD